jgi:hypothetical protein
MEGGLLRLIISSRSVNKHVHDRQFLFLIGCIPNQKQELHAVAMFANRSGRNEQSSWRCFLPSFGSFGQAVSEEKIF